MMENKAQGKAAIIRGSIATFLLVAVFLTACQEALPLESPTPSVTLVTIETAVAETVVAEIPTTVPVISATPEPTSTDTPVPTATTHVFTEPDDPLAGIQTSNPRAADKLQVIADAGAAWTHYTALEWDRIEPARTNPPTFIWERAEEEGMQLAAEKGLTLIANISFAPYWAQKIPGYPCGPIAEEAFQRFGIFMQEAVLRYSKPPYNVKYWEIGNEPDVLPRQVEPRSPFGCWGDATDPYFGGGYYAAMLKTVVPYIKAADPEAQVLIGGLLLGCHPDIPYQRSDGSLIDCSPARFLEGVLLYGGGDFFDGISFHAYDYYYQEFGKYGHLGWHSDYSHIGPVLIAKTEFLRQLLTKYGYTNKSMHTTEVALLCGSTGKESYCRTDEFQKTKADYAVYSLVASQALNLDSYIWYELLGWRASGLVRADLSPFPVYTNFQFAAKMLAKTAFVRTLEISGAFTYEFVLPETNQRLWVIWSSNGQDIPLILPQMPEGIYNAMGENQPATDAMILTPSPIYILWPPGELVDPLSLP